MSNYSDQEYIEAIQDALETLITGISSVDCIKTVKILEELQGKLNSNIPKTVIEEDERKGYIYSGNEMSNDYD